MSSAEVTQRESPTWRDLLRLAGSARGGRALVGALAQQVLAGSGLESLALYLESGGVLRRSVQAGAASFPARLDSARSGEYGRYEVPGGQLVYEPGGLDGKELDHHALLALFCAARAADLSHRLKRSSFEANFRGVELQSLYDVGLAIAGTLELDELGEEVLLRAVSLLDARVGAFYRFSGEIYELERTFGGDARQQVEPDDARLRALLAGESGGDPLLPGTTHPLCVPIEADGKRLGLLVVADKESRTGVGPFAGGDRRMLELFANQAAIALENAHLHRQALEKERLERELDLAADIQRQLLPDELPRLDGFEFAGWSRPARHVGGDYYDVRLTEDDGVHVVLGDVSGKGMPAALLVSTLHSALRLLLSARPFDAKLVERANRHIADASGSNKFITMMIARLDPASGSLSYVNAGHNPPLVVRRDGSVEELPAGGMPLGIFGAAPYGPGEVRLGRGDLLCIFSDGITECETPLGEEFGPQRLTQLLLRVAGEPLTDVIGAIDRAVVEFAAGGPQGDDQTVVLLRRS